jgi:hypothetical protein
MRNASCIIVNISWHFGFRCSCIYISVDDGTAVIECHHRPPAPNQSKDDKTKELPLLKPLAHVGCSVVMIGRISGWHETRRILVDSIGQFHTIAKHFEPKLS